MSVPLLLAKRVFRDCGPVLVRASPVMAFSTTRRRSLSSFPVTDSLGMWYHPRVTVPCHQRRLLHSSVPIFLASTSSSSSSSSSSSTTTNSTNSTTTTTTTTTTTINNSNENNDFDTTIDPSNQSPPSVSSSSSSSSSSSGVSRRFRKGLGTIFSTMGFLSSSLSSVLKDPFKVWDQTQEPLQAFRNFLKTSGIDQELLQHHPGTSAVTSMALLFRVHSTTSSTTSSTITSSISSNNKSNNNKEGFGETRLDVNFWTRARRYMRYATAVYGRSMIRAATVDARGSFRDLAESVGQETLQTIAKHIQVPVQDLVWVEVDYDYDNTATNSDDSDNDNNHNTNTHHYLRHLVAVDHAHQEVVLAIRGTFSIQEIVVDLTSFSREGFVGGEAHEGMATMAERLWQIAGPAIVKTLQEHPNYRLVLTGHSLGAGTASLLTILLKQQQQDQNYQRAMSSPAATVPKIPLTTSVQCFAYASPPVFTPLDLIPHVTPCITNFIHERDVVPFLSVYSVRHVLASLQAIQSVELSRADKWAIIAGTQPPPPELVAAVQNVPSVVPIRGAPRLQIPAAKTIWLHTPTQSSTTPVSPDSSTTSYTVCETLPFEIRVHPNMLVDHFPARYEYALEHLSIQ